MLKTNTKKWAFGVKERITAVFIAAVALCIVAAVVLITALSGGGTVTADGDLMKGISKKRTTAKIDDDFKKQYASFAAVMLSEVADKTGNAAFSISNTMSSAAFMAYSADDDTRGEMEKLLGGDSIKTAKQLSGIEQRIGVKSTKDGMHFSNTVWLDNERVYPVKKSFLRTNGKYFGLSFERLDFAATDANDTVINAVSAATGNMVYPVINIGLTDNMNVISGANFVSKWKEPVVTDTYAGLFTGVGGGVTATFFETVSDGVIDGTTFTGITKAFDGDFTFVALVPKATNENLINSVSDVVNELSQDNGLATLLEQEQEKKVAVVMPSYSNSIAAPTTTDFTAVFKEKGSAQLFDDDTVLSGMTSATGLCYDRVIASGDISLSPYGVGASGDGKEKMNEKLLEETNGQIRFDRSFLYFIVDNDSGLPVYAAFVNDIL